MTNGSTLTVEPDTEEQPTETPTVVVCEGDGGIAKGRELFGLAEREGIEERLCIIAINSRTEAFSGFPEEMHRIELSLPEGRHRRCDKQNRYYLSPQDEFGSMPGARRIRRIARYYMDNAENVGSYERRLRRKIETFVEGFLSDPNVDGPEAVNVFQFVAAGGGTGSGIMPMVTGMLDVITDDLTRKLDVGFEHWATVTLATLEDFWIEGTRPDVSWRYIANSLALLDELRALTGYDDVEYPLTIPVMAAEDGANIQRSVYRLHDNPFSGVFLQRYDEDTATDNEQYRTAVNRTAATLVLRWMRTEQDGFQGLENEAVQLEDIFYEIRAASFEPPTDDVARLLEAKQSQDAAEEKLGELEAERTELSTAIDQLEAGIDARQIIRSDDLVAADEASEETLEDGMQPVPEVVVTAFDRAREVASNVSPASSRMESIETQLEEHQTRRSFSFHDRVDGEALQRAVFMAAVGDVVRSALNNHQFRSKVREFVDEQEEKITEFDSAFEPTTTPKEQFIQTIEPLLEQQLETLEARLDEFGLADRLTNHQEYAELKEQRDRTRSALDSFQRAEKEFDHLTQLAEQLEEERTATVASLEETRRELKAVRSDIEADITRVRQEQATATDRIQRLEREVLESPLEQNMTLPVSNDAQLQSDLFDEDPGIAALIKAGVIDRGTVTNQLRSTLDDSKKGLVDEILERRGKDRSPPRGRLYMFCSSDTEELIWSDAPHGDAPKRVARDVFEREVATVTCNDDGRVTLLAVYGNVSPENFDHGDLRDSLMRGRPELWGDEIDLQDCYAYPELLPSSHPVSIPRQVDEADIPTRGDADD